MPQLIRIILTGPRLLKQFIYLNFRWPHQAKVIKVFDKTSYATVRIDLFIGVKSLFY